MKDRTNKDHLDPAWDIQPDHAGMFIVMQLLGALLATLLMRRLLNDHQ